MSTPPDGAEPLVIRRFGSGGTTRIGVETFIVDGGDEGGGLFGGGLVVPDSGCGMGVDAGGLNVPGGGGTVTGAAVPGVTAAGGAVIVGGAAG
jgi:hypothetical protein